MINFRLEQSIVCVPEPATLAMMIPGFGGVSFLTDRRRSQLMLNRHRN